MYVEEMVINADTPNSFEEGDDYQTSLWRSIVRTPHRKFGYHEVAKFMELI